jgi:GGDEF domain-containing protein
MGGDEFVVVTGPEHRRLATELGDLVRTVAVAEDLDIACSVGVATAEPGDDAGTMLRRADEAMYAIKVHRH